MSIAAARAFAHGLIAANKAGSLARDGADLELCDLFASRGSCEGACECSAAEEVMACGAAGEAAEQAAEDAANMEAAA